MLSIVECPACGVRVMPKAGGICPSCGERLSVNAEIVAEAAVATAPPSQSLWPQSEGEVALERRAASTVGMPPAQVALVRRLAIKLEAFGILFGLNVINVGRCLSEPQLAWLWFGIAISGGGIGVFLILASNRLGDVRKSSERFGPRMHEFLTTLDHLSNVLIILFLVVLFAALLVTRPQMPAN